MGRAEREEPEIPIFVPNSGFFHLDLTAGKRAYLERCSTSN